MALFDSYQPRNAFSCPVCGTPQREWQGKDGPCGLFVFREGITGAVAQVVDEDCLLSPAQIASQRLPDEFTIYAHDCGCAYPTVLRCRGSLGSWQATELFTGSASDRLLRGAELREHWRARLCWLDTVPPSHVPQ
jgi:hypothetical protein